MRSSSSASAPASTGVEEETRSTDTPGSADELQPGATLRQNPSQTAQRVFEHGAFTSDDTDAVTGVLRWGLLQMPFYFALIAGQQALFSFSRYRLALGIAAASLAVKILLSVLTVPDLGIAGLMLATAGMYAVSSGITVYALVRLQRAATVAALRQRRDGAAADPLGFHD